MPRRTGAHMLPGYSTWQIVAEAIGNNRAGSGKTVTSTDGDSAAVQRQVGVHSAIQYCSRSVCLSCGVLAHSLGSSSHSFLFSLNFSFSLLLLSLLFVLDLPHSLLARCMPWWLVGGITPSAGVGGLCPLALVCCSLEHPQGWVVDIFHYSLLHVLSESPVDIVPGGSVGLWDCAATPLTVC